MFKPAALCCCCRVWGVLMLLSPCLKHAVLQVVFSNTGSKAAAAREQAIQEAALAVSLSHPNVVSPRCPLYPQPSTQHIASRGTPSTPLPAAS